MEETTTMQETEQNAQPAEETQGQQADGTKEKMSAFQKLIDGFFGGGKKEEGSEKKEDAPAAEPPAEEKPYSQADMEAAIEAAKQQWAAEAERMKKLTPEERAKEEQKRQNDEIADLKSQLLQKELRETAAKTLEAEGLPAGLTDVLDYSSKERMEETLKNTMKIFKENLDAAVKYRLRGRTPEGLGGAASTENLLRDQIARNIRGL